MVERTTFGGPQFIWIKKFTLSGKEVWSQKLDGYYHSASHGNGKILITSVIEKDTTAEFIIWEINATQGGISNQLLLEYSSYDYEIKVANPLPNGNYLFTVTPEDSNEFSVCTYNHEWKKIGCISIPANYSLSLQEIDFKDEREVYLAYETEEPYQYTTISCLGIQSNGGYKLKWTKRLPEIGSSPQGIMVEGMGDFWVANDSFQKRQVVHFTGSNPTKPTSFNFDEAFPFVSSMDINPNGSLCIVFINYYFRDNENRSEENKLAYYWVEVNKENKATILGPKTFKNFNSSYGRTSAPVAIINEREILLSATSSNSNAGSYFGNVYKVKF
jgi:hypothetical protein